jgi:hypothetical protein
MVLFLLLACTGDGPFGSDSDGGACGASPASVEVGGGAMAFEPAADGDAVTMVHGPQGGWHVLASVRLDDVDPIVSLHYTIAVQPEGTVVSDNAYRVQSLEDTPCGGYYPGMYGYLLVDALAEGELDTPPELLAGRELLLRIDIEDEAGRTASDTLTAIAALDPIDADTGAP